MPPLLSGNRQEAEASVQIKEEKDMTGRLFNKALAIGLSLALMMSLAACGGSTDQESTGGQSPAQTADQNTNQNSSASDSSATADAVTDDSIHAAEATGAFSLTSEDGTFTQSGSIYTITAAGTYVLSGALNGQILVDAGDDDEVVLELSGVTISYDQDSPIKCLNADKVEISAKADTENVIKDTRSTKTVSSGGGNGAIYAKTDLKLKGSGVLVVTAGYNNGVETTKDLTIQKLSLKVTAYNNAIKGGDSVTVKSGAVVAISTNGDGVETENTDANKTGETRGDILLSGGSITVYAAGDAFQAAHSFTMEADEEGNTPVVLIYTGAYSGYTASGASTTSYKGVKVQDELNISAGSLEIHSYDDGLHADYGTSFEAGGKGRGTINISGGSVSMSVYSPENKTAGGRMGPGGRGGWSNQQTVSGADGIHADYKLNISGGTVNIDSAYEGLEANVISISGGTIYVAGNDDGVNATKGQETAQINISGGYLDVTVSANGDTDGIDSNGSYIQSGGIVITRGPSSEMAAAIDADGSVSISGGTLIILGYGRVSASGNVKQYSLSLHSSGSHSVTIGGTSYTFTNAGSYGSTSCYSSVSVK